MRPYDEDSIDYESEAPDQVDWILTVQIPNPIFHNSYFDSLIFEISFLAYPMSSSTMQGPDGPATESVCVCTESVHVCTESVRCLHRIGVNYCQA